MVGLVAQVALHKIVFGWIALHCSIVHCVLEGAIQNREGVFVKFSQFIFRGEGFSTDCFRESVIK